VEKVLEVVWRSLDHQDSHRDIGEVGQQRSAVHAGWVCRNHAGDVLPDMESFD